jgi:hypothetical protein
MAAPATTTTAWQWPAEVLAFAAQQQVQAYLEPLREATGRVFPTLDTLKITLEGDPEIRDDWHIVFWVRVPQPDIPHFVEAQHRWIDELYRICPAPLVCTFRLVLMPVAS